MVVSANALLLAGSSFLIDKGLMRQCSSFNKVLLGILIISFIVITACSVYYSITGIISPWKTSREMFGYIPERVFFHTGDTVKEFRNYGFEEFRQKFSRLDEDRIIYYALPELWTGIQQQSYRYKRLKKAVKLLCISITIYLITTIIIILMAIFNNQYSKYPLEKMIK